MLSTMLGVPEEIKSPESKRARVESRALFAALLYSGDESAMLRDLTFYTDGFLLLARDGRRVAPLLLKQHLSAGEERTKEAFLADLRALIPFTVLILNSFPFTPAVLRWSESTAAPAFLKPMFASPTAFSDKRLKRYALAKQKLETRA
jgi:hypothetical protein